MEELQSDWAREARKMEGRQADYMVTYRNKVDGTNANPEVFKTEAEATTYIQKLVRDGNAMDIRTEARNKGVPNNPLLKNWQELSVKRALKEAVDNNSEYFAWINGEQTSARYNLATQVENVKWSKWNKDGNIKLIEITPNKGEPINIHLEKNKNGVITDSGNEAWKGKKLDEVLGKGLADKIMEKESGTLSGEGLKFGGEWANNLYDKQVANIVSDLTGAKVEKLDLGLPIEGKSKTWSFVKKGEMVGEGLLPENLKVGLEITDKDFGITKNTYIITDILGIAIVGFAPIPAMV
jgi:hypothetical protein